MNILIPDSWLREFIETKATPKQIKEYLSLCGPSVERIHQKDGEVIYDIEITGNRPDAMSVIGVAREAVAILPRFGIAAKLISDPYAQKVRPFVAKKNYKTLAIKTDPVLNPRWTSIVFDNVKVKPSPAWLRKKLEATGIRSLNNVIDITNYLLRTYGQPAHAFDFDAISDKLNHATMILRTSKKGEKLVTLDGKSHILPGNDIIIEDGKGRLIDLCGIMGAQNSAIKETTKTVILFLQTYDPVRIRKTMMHLSHRSEAGGLFEKGVDAELVRPAFTRGAELITQLTEGKIASKLYDIYPKRYEPWVVSVARSMADAYIGIHLADKEISQILTPLGFQTTISKDSVSVTVPSFRRDITIDVDIIEELARMYGYHNIKSKLPATAPPVVIPDETLRWEEEIKIRLRDWGFTEIYSYSMISENLLDIFNFDKTKVYKIANPLSNEWVYMRPHLLPSVLSVVAQNLQNNPELKLFELSMTYRYSPNDLPLETPVLIVVWTGEKFSEAKGLAQALFQIFGIKFPKYEAQGQNIQLDVYNQKRLLLGLYGSLGELNTTLLSQMGIHVPVTRLYLDFSLLVSHAKPIQKFNAIPKYPPIIEDLTFDFPQKTYLGTVAEFIKLISPEIYQADIGTIFGNSVTFNIQYLSYRRPLTNKDAEVIRSQIVSDVEKKFNAKLKGKV